MTPTPFWQLFHAPRDTVALIEDGGATLTYGELAQQVGQVQAHLPARALLFCFCENSAASLTGYLAALNARAVPVMLDGQLDDTLADALLARWQPGFLWLPESRQVPGNVLLRQNGYQLVATGEPAPAMDDALALLITTSGSTGSPKLVRQSYQNLISNCESICDYLAIDASERPLVYLPMNYVFGLSVIHSHLARGATLLMTRNGPVQPGFWAFVKSQQATSLAGVPYTFEMLNRLRFMRMALPSLRTLTQAGGKLSAALHEAFAAWAQAQDKRFIVMYGASEATSRMGYLPPEQAASLPGAMGIAIPGGRFTLEDEAGNEIATPDETGELIYYGANVCLGYAQTRDDLARGDDFRGRLATGDLARRDAQGIYTIVGRKKRFLKVFGNRVGLDELEQLVKNQFVGLDCATGGVDDRITLFLTDETQSETVKSWLAQTCQLHHSAFRVVVLASIPKNAAGKTLYAQLEALSA
ncbi:AMP-dependent synthetase [Cronobacter condimenti 1330]|uniref:AMP-dependent synthetase n=1 Tax=Cronobacter condimenti 1330 TaxID=1073999 RepID=A0ABM5VDB2_9ENTR|nr:AMP-binding protein [Cronobacter condimenti]ALB63183.1 AMP-dependent synthetase [Cronobacter condimenti 1330]